MDTPAPDSNGPLLGEAMKRVAQRAFVICENRFQLLLVEVQEERERVLHSLWLGLAAAATTNLNMIHFTTFFALVVSGMDTIQPAAAAVLAGRSPRINLGLVNTFQRRQTPPPQCATICNPVTNAITSISTSSCSPSVCCTDSFETSFFNCFTCVYAAANLTDFTEIQSTLDELYNTCAINGTKIPELTFPGQNPNRPLSSVVSPISTATTSSTSESITQSTFSPSTSSTPATTTPSQSTVTNVNTPTPTSSSVSSAGIRSVEKGCFNLIIVTMMLGTGLFLAAYY